LFALEPEIVTPIGLAVDAQNRVLVIESNTHEVKAGYLGHPHDRIKVFEDRDNDGKPEKSWVFADGLRQVMNLAFAPQKDLYATYRAGVFRFGDMDNDGVSDARSEIVNLETEERYPHNGIDGLAFSPDGWLYFGLGE